MKSKEEVKEELVRALRESKIEDLNPAEFGCRVCDGKRCQEGLVLCGVPDLMHTVWSYLKLKNFRGDSW